MNVLDIKSPADIKQLNYEELETLASEIRHFLIHSLSKTGGHLSSNLGVVELTLAMHYAFDSKCDKFIYDVGHQAYVHKILTGRSGDFNTLRQYKGLSGFQKRCESEHDVWEAGHSSTSLSAALGYAVTRDLNHQNYHVLPVIGDGAMASGMSFEALNQIGSENRKIVIIFNDNNMSISQNVGAMSHVFTKLRASKGYTGLKKDLSHYLSVNKFGSKVLHSMRNIKNNIKHVVVDASFFNEFNIDYIGPIDGHDMKEMIRVFDVVKQASGPIVVHVITKKGKGYPYAEADMSGKWHGVGKFDITSGKAIATTKLNHLDWSSIMSNALIEMAKTNEDIVALTPAMSSGSKLDEFASLFPDRFFDCGIAEEHTMVFAAALALSGKRPFVSIYSSFLQRAYDQVNHDIARMNVPVVVSVDRSGLVGEDGDTHHGVFDISFLRSIPNLILSQPQDANEARNLLYSALHQKQPYFIRIPRGTTSYKPQSFTLIETGTWTAWQQQDHVSLCVITYGEDVSHVINRAKIEELPIMVVNARFFKPLDESMLHQILASTMKIIVFETDMLKGGLSSAILEFANDHAYKHPIKRIGIEDHFVPHGSLVKLKQLENIDIDTLFLVINKELSCV